MSNKTVTVKKGHSVGKTELHPEGSSMTDKKKQLPDVLGDIQKTIENDDMADLHNIPNHLNARSVWLIEKLWTNSEENEASSSIGYEPIGFTLSERDAAKIVKESGTQGGKDSGWPFMGRVYPNLRAKELPYLPPNEELRGRT